MAIQQLAFAATHTTQLLESYRDAVRAFGCGLARSMAIGRPGRFPFPFSGGVSGFVRRTVSHSNHHSQKLAGTPRELPALQLGGHVPVSHAGRGRALFRVPIPEERSRAEILWRGRPLASRAGFVFAAGRVYGSAALVKVVRPVTLRLHLDNARLAGKLRRLGNTKRICEAFGSGENPSVCRSTKATQPSHGTGRPSFFKISLPSSVDDLCAAE
jgi:hypothetical protein